MEVAGSAMTQNHRKNIQKNTYRSNRMTTVVFDAMVVFVAGVLDYCSMAIVASRR